MCAEGSKLGNAGSRQRAPAWRVGLLLLAVFPALGCAFFFDEKNDSPIARWTLEEGWGAPARGEPSPTAAALRVEAKKAFDAKSYEDSVRGLLAIEELLSDSLEAGEAYTSFLIAECYFYLNQYEDANTYYQRTLARSPSEDILNQTLHRVYTIGLAYLHSKAKRSFAGVRYRSPSFGVDILLGERGLATRYPYLSFSDDAHLEVATYYFNKGEYGEAELVLERLVRDYPDSEWNETAVYQLAVSVFEQVRGVEYDQRPLKKARRKFDIYRNEYPRGVYIINVREHTRKISEMQASHDLEVAKYYLRESRPESSLYYLRSVLLNYPRTEAYIEAQAMYDELARYRDAAYEQSEQQNSARREADSSRVDFRSRSDGGGAE